MVIRIIGRRLIVGAVVTGALLFTASSLALAQDTSKLVYERCSDTGLGCHSASRWENAKKPGNRTWKEYWSSTVDRMVRYKAILTNTEADLVVEYLTAKSEGRINQPTTTTTKASSTTTTTKSSSKNDAGTVGTVTTEPPLPPVTVEASAATTSNVPSEQAETGIEMIWYLLGGGILIGSGMALRNQDEQLAE